MTTQLPTRLASIALVLAVVGLAVSPAPAVAAEDDESFFDGLVSEDGERGWLASAALTLTKATSGISRSWQDWTTDPGKADQYATDWADEVNDNSAEIAAYASERLDASDSYDTFRVDFADRDDGEATRYVVSDVSNGSWENLRVVTPDEFDDLNRTVDHTVTANWHVSRNAAEETATFVKDYVEPGESLSTTYKAAMVSKYGGGLESGLWGSV